MSKLIFGPITSRRFGQSLGIDLSPDIKQCNFDCLYCELKVAKTVDKATVVPRVDEVVHAVNEALPQHQHVDVLTLTANGEPTLYPFLKELIDRLLLIPKRPKLLILSNGSTIGNSDIREALLPLDIVKLSLDCVSSRAFKRLDRAHASIDIETIVEGMKAFRKRYHGELVIEILVVKTINDSVEEFEALNRVLQEIQPDRIDVGTIDRPPAYDVQGVEIERLIELTSHLHNLAVNIAYKKSYIPQKRYFSKEEIYELLKRRPQSSEDIRLCFDDESVDHLNELLSEERLYIKNIAGVDFYKVNE